MTKKNMYPRYLIPVRDALHNMSLRENKNTESPNSEYYRGILVGMVSVLMGYGLTFQESWKYVKDNLPTGSISPDYLMPQWEE